MSTWQGQPIGPGPGATPGIEVRSYKGKLQEATQAFQADAVVMARSGWFPTNQQYTPGSWGCGAFLVALLLCIIAIGILVFIYLIVVKPAGVLVVTYEFRGLPETESPRPAVEEGLQQDGAGTGS